jgi:type I restriction enzyme M protein
MLGAIIGDIIGSRFEFNNIKTKDFELFDKTCFMTDDSIMTLAVAEICINNYFSNSKEIINTFKKWGNLYPNCGYGERFYNWLFSNNNEPYNSFGNGSAMRISPVAYYAKNEEEIIKYAKAVTEVTHNHPEGIKGALVTAMCIFYARIGKTKEEIKQYVKKYYNIDFDYEKLKKEYKFNSSCMESVPQAIYCFLISNDFEDCIKTTISIGGDSDTTTCIACSIAEAYYGIPEHIKKEVYKYIPDNIQQKIKEFYNSIES